MREHVAQPGVTGPDIAPLEWRVAGEVLGGEASHFTPWLAEHLDLLGAALGIEGLELVSTESNVAGKRLDVLAAMGEEQDGEMVGVAIENQYGTSEHGHLGQLVTYVAGVAATYNRVLGVWLVDHIHPAHEAAVELLNRETTDRLGFVLARPRFVRFGEGRWGVDFDVGVQPNEFIRTERRRTSAVTPEREQFLEAVANAARPTLLQAGFKAVGGAHRGYTANITWGDSRWRVHARVAKPNDGFRAMIYVDGYPSTEANEELLRQLTAHAHLIESELRHPHVLDLEAHKTSPLAKKAAIAVCRWPGVGYLSDPDEASERLGEFGIGVAAAAKAAGL